MLKFYNFHQNHRITSYNVCYTKLLRRIEQFFANQIGTEDSVTTSSGTLAGRLILEQLSKLGNVFYHYPKTHPSILHNNSSPLFIDDKLHPNLLSNVEENIVIATDAVS